MKLKEAKEIINSFPEGYDDYECVIDSEGMALDNISLIEYENIGKKCINFDY